MSRYRLYGIVPYPRRRTVLIQGITLAFCQGEDREYPAGTFLWEYPEEWSEQRIRKFEYNHCQSNPKGVSPSRMLEICNKHKFKFLKTEPFYAVLPSYYDKELAAFATKLEMRLGEGAFMNVSFGDTQPENDKFVLKHFPVRKPLSDRIIIPEDFFGIESLSRQMGIVEIANHDRFWLNWKLPPHWPQEKRNQFIDLIRVPCHVTRKILFDFWAE